MPHSKGFAEEPQPYDAQEGGVRSVSYQRLKIDKAGRLVIPAEMRMAMGANPGEPLTAEVVDGELRLQSRTTLLKRIRAQAEKSRADHPGSAVDELIADRREEARREDEKYEKLEREARATGKTRARRK